MLLFFNVCSTIISQYFTHSHRISMFPYMFLHPHKTTWWYTLNILNLFISFIFIEEVGKPWSHIHHHCDIWHKAKTLAKEIREMARTKALKLLLLPWIRPITNHFWYCCGKSKGSVGKYAYIQTSQINIFKRMHSWSHSDFSSTTLHATQGFVTTNAGTLLFLT